VSGEGRRRTARPVPARSWGVEPASGHARRVGHLHSWKTWDLMMSFTLGFSTPKTREEILSATPRRHRPWRLMTLRPRRAYGNSRLRIVSRVVTALSLFVLHARRHLPREFLARLDRLLPSRVRRGRWSSSPRRPLGTGSVTSRLSSARARRPATPLRCDLLVQRSFWTRPVTVSASSRIASWVCTCIGRAPAQVEPGFTLVCFLTLGLLMLLTSTKRTRRDQGHRDDEDAVEERNRFHSRICRAQRSRRRRRA
jgi:hypothetical protein